MYDAALLQERMAELGLNFYRLSQQCKPKIDPKTAKHVVTTGTGNPDSVRAVADALGFRNLKDIVKRNGSRKRRAAG